MRKFLQMYLYVWRCIDEKLCHIEFVKIWIWSSIQLVHFSNEPACDERVVLSNFDTRVTLITANEKVWKDKISCI